MVSAVQELEKAAELCARIRFSADESRLAASLLAPTAGFLGAETASFRSMSGDEDAPKPGVVVGLGIPRCVHDAYIARYFMLDPARRLLHRRLASPLFAEPALPGEWSRERVSAVERQRRREEFLRYRKEFLLPNDFYHHVGFCLQDAHGQILLFDFHRPARAPEFGALELARARVLAIYLQAMATRSGHLDALRHVDSASDRLSEREAQVADAVARGLSNKEIAAGLAISVRTVENHLRSIFAKLGVTTRTRLAARLR